MYLSCYSKGVETIIMTERHQLIYLKKQPQFELTSTHQHTDAIRQAIASWLDAGLPCIYTRQPSPNASSIHLGLTVLIAKQRHRAGLVIDEAMIERNSPLPTLNECVESLTHGQQASDNEIIHVYGSFLFQYLSKDTLFPRPSFVNKNSDLDLLIDYRHSSLQDLAVKMSALSDAAQRRIDGEIRFNGVGDLSIHELVNTASDQLLVKTSKNTFLMSRTKLYEYYPSLLS